MILGYFVIFDVTQLLYFAMFLLRRIVDAWNENEFYCLFVVALSISLNRHSFVE